MSLRFILFRLRADWPRILLVLVCASLFYFWEGWSSTAPTAKYPFFETVYGNVSTANLAAELDLEVGQGADLREVFDAFILSARNMLYAQAVEGADLFGALPCACLLSILLISSLFRRGRVASWLSAGYSRGRVFLSLTLLYYGCAVLIWLIASHLIMAAFRISFSPEEQDFYRTTQLAWLTAFLFRASILYLAAFLVRRPIPAALAGLGVCLLFLLLKSALPCIPVHIGPGDYRDWHPGADLSTLVTGCWIAAGAFLLSVPAAWLSFRKRGLE